MPTRLFYPWNSPVKNTGVGSHFLLQGIFLTQGSNPGLLNYQQILYCLSHQGSLNFMTDRRGKGWKQRQTLFSWASKITVDGNCSHEIKRNLLLGRKATTNLDSVLKSRDINLPTKVHIVKALIFPAVMYGCESWTIKKAECQRTDAFELWCWRRLLRVPWTAGDQTNQS